MKSERININKAKQKFLEFKNSESVKLGKEKELWRENLKIVESLKCQESDILDLDIGGTHKITTTRSTLSKVNIWSKFLVSQFSPCCYVLWPTWNTKAQ